MMTLATSTEIPRRRRFRRSEPLWPVQITPRDLALIEHVRRHRFLSSVHLVALDGGNKSNVLACLRVLFDSGYLDRPHAQLASVPAIGNQPMVYGLGARGARLLRQYGHLITDSIDWTEKTKRAGAVCVDHTLAVADFMVRVELACRHTHRAEIIREGEIIAGAPAATQTSREPLRWVVDRSTNGRKQTWSVVPDALFGLRFPDETGTFVLLEIDRGTIPLLRNTESHRSIRRKLETYIEGWRAGRHLQQFGLKNLRVLVVTSSDARMQHMLDHVH